MTIQATISIGQHEETMPGSRAAQGREFNGTQEGNGVNSVYSVRNGSIGGIGKV